MVDEARREVDQRRQEPMSKRLDRVLERMESLTGRQRAEALASAGVIKNNEITKVARRLDGQD